MSEIIRFNTLGNSPIFENLKGEMRPQDVASEMKISIETIYGWRAKSKTRKVPKDLFVKFNGQLWIRTDSLKRWISSQNDQHSLA